MTLAIGMRRIVWYARVSSDDQRDRATIQTQIEELERAVARTPGVEVVERYVDDGVSGMIPISARPAGGRLVRDRLAGRFSEVWVYDVDRLGRDAPDIMRARRDLAALEISIFTPTGEVPPLLFDLQAVIGDYARVQFLKRSADGMARAAREGRYCGGIVPYGYRVRGTKESARPIPDEEPVWADWSSAAVVRWVYERLGIDGWSCPRIADELNARGVPTHYARDGRLLRRGERRASTQGLWRSGRIANLVRNPVYRGELQYGRRTTKRGREVISAPVEGLVSPALWHAAQATLKANRSIPKNTPRTYLLRGVLRCGIDDLTYVGSRGRDDVGWYRCNGQLVERGPIPGRCWGQSVRTDAIEPTIKADVERWLRDPGEVLADLDGAAEAELHTAVVEAETVTLRRGLAGLEEERTRAIHFAVQGTLSAADLAPELARIDAQRTELERRLATLVEPEEPLPDEAIDLAAELQARLDAGLSTEQWQQIIRLLVRATIHTETCEDGRKRAWAEVTYRFPGVVETSTGSRAAIRTGVRRP